MQPEHTNPEASPGVSRGGTAIRTGVGSPDQQFNRSVCPVAKGTLHSGTINVSPNQVPLYLVPQVVAAVVNRYGRAIREIHVVRSGGHQYAISTLAGVEAHE